MMNQTNKIPFTDDGVPKNNPLHNQVGSAGLSRQTVQNAHNLW